MSTHEKPGRARLVIGKPIALRMTAQELEQVNRLAQEQGRSLSNMVRQICLAGLSQMQGDTKASAKTAGMEP